jgi:hypothetical protein
LLTSPLIKIVAILEGIHSKENIMRLIRWEYIDCPPQGVTGEQNGDTGSSGTHYRAPTLMI